jgi:hypothetical protein
MQKRLDRQVEAVGNWGSEATQEIWLAIVVGVLGLAIGALQPTNIAKLAAAVIGPVVSAITLFTNLFYPADYRTLQRSVAEATPIIEDLQETLSTFDPNQTPENQLAIEADFKSKCGKIDQIAERLLNGQANDSQVKESWAPFKTRVVYAQSDSHPAWTASRQQSDKISTYFVGEARNVSLPLAKTAAEEGAFLAAGQWLMKSQPNQSSVEPSPQLLQLLK